MMKSKSVKKIDATKAEKDKDKMSETVKTQSTKATKTPSTKDASKGGAGRDKTPGKEKGLHKTMTEKIIPTKDKEKGKAITKKQKSLENHSN